MHRIEIEQIADHDLRTISRNACARSSSVRTLHRFTVLQQQLGDVAPDGADAARRTGDHNGTRRHSYFIRSAALSASSRAASLNGLNRHSIAPCSRRFRRMVLSPLAVINTIGMFRRRCISSC